ncbi:MAG TPA: hypothetical protein VEC57_10045 [Candidatus Limnocylindrales bacterium]|nr:hypothetical protein [Candidatus Limnocylindrales bacterium]
MRLYLLKLLVTAVIVATASSLAGRSSALAGFLVAMPLTTMIVLPMAELEHRGTGVAVELARHILLALPFSLLFFAPFVVAERLELSFWKAYVLGCTLLLAGYAGFRVLSRGL